MSAQRIELVASAQQTANGNSAAFAVNTATMAMVGLDITAYTGATGFTAWLQGSDDGGTTWYDLVADQVLDSTAVEIGGTVLTNERDICDDVAAAGKHSAIYKHLAADQVRLAWDLDGTDITFSCSAVVK